MAIAYISLLNTINNIAERDQFKGRPLIALTDEGHIPLKVPMPSLAQSPDEPWYLGPSNARWVITA